MRGLSQKRVFLYVTRTMMNRFPTQVKVACGFVLLLLLLVVAINVVYQKMSSLLETNRVEQNYVDSLKVLLEDREKKNAEIYQMLDTMNQEPNYQHYVDKLIETRRPLIRAPKVKRSKVTVTKQYTEKQKKGFFKRLGDVFRSHKKDSANVKTVSTTVVIDSVETAYNPTDSMRQLLTQARSHHERSARRMQEKEEEMKEHIRQLNQRVSGLLQAMQHEDSLMQKYRSYSIQEAKAQSIKTMGIITMTALVLAAIFLFIIWRDIFRSNEYRQQLEQANAKSNQLLKEREQLMLTITHDIKAPTSSILGHIDLLRRITHDSRQLSYLENMQSAARHLLRMISSLLDFHKLDSHKMDVESVIFQPAQLMETIYLSFKPTAKAKGLQFRWENRIDTSQTVSSDAFRIRQIIENLLSNAIKFTEKGSVTLKTELQGPQLLIDVTDTGCGISPADQKRMFQEFTRLKNAQGQEGFGLGLTITLQLVQLLKGTITVDSKEGEGTTFHVMLPTTLTQTRIPVSTLPFHVLMIDDDRLQLQMMQAMLQHTVESITTCLQPEEMLQRLRSHDYNLILTDIQMPAMNGIEMVKEIRKIPSSRDIPVIALTARSDLSAQELQEHGFAGCLHKPFTADDFKMVASNLRQFTEQGNTSPRHTQKVEANYDFSALTAFSGEDQEAAKEIMETFLSETRKNRETMAKAIHEQDTTTISALAHKMLPLFIQIGAETSITPLKALEAKKGDPTFSEEISREATIVCQEAQKVETAIQETLAQPSPTGKG